MKYRRTASETGYRLQHISYALLCRYFIQLSLELCLQVFDARLKKVIKVIVFIKKMKINQNRALLCLPSTSVTNRRTATSTKIMYNLNRILNKSCLLIPLL